MKKWVLFLVIALIAVGLFGYSNVFGDSYKRSVGIVQKNTEALYPAYEMVGTARKWGYINAVGKFVIKPQYDSAGNFMSDGLAKVSLNDNFGIIDRTGKLIVGLKFNSIEDYKDGVAVAYAVPDKGSKGYCILDEAGKIVFKNASIISDFSDGLAAFSYDSGDSVNYKYGYVEKTGKVVIGPRYKMSGNFVNGKALVKIEDGHYSVIDKKGNLINKLNYNHLFSFSDNAICYSQRDGKSVDKYGFITPEGKVLIGDKFSNTAEFKNGLAIVSVGDYGGKYGVIDKKGNYIIPPQYGDITEIGGGLFGVSEYKEDYAGLSGNYLRKAIFNSSGKRLTEFKYYDFNWISNNEISVSDDKETYLIDENGKRSTTFGSFTGVGTINKIDNVYRINIGNYDMYYYDSKGKELWKSSNTINLGNGLSIKQLEFYPDRCTSIDYPQIDGLSNKNIQNTINKKLKQYFVGSAHGSEKENGMYTDDLSINYGIDKNKDLLIVTYDQYDYPIGAAHGMPYREDYHINIKNGTFYNLKDLFKKGSNFNKLLIDKAKSMMEKDNKERAGGEYTIENNLKLSNFKIKKDALCIYFQPYEVAPYAAGFPEFYISYKDIMGIIDTKGQFWNSFDRDINTKSVADEAEDINDEDKARINKLMSGYENGLINAINKNNFELVKPWLYPNSDLYKSQQQLVKSINTKGIKERLDGFTINKIGLNNDGTVLHIYVTENISIKYPGKEFVLKHFKWVYSAIESDDQKGYQLTYLEK